MVVPTPIFDSTRKVPPENSVLSHIPVSPKTLLMGIFRDHFFYPRRRRTVVHECSKPCLALPQRFFHAIQFKKGLAQLNQFSNELLSGFVFVYHVRMGLFGKLEVKSGKGVISFQRFLPSSFTYTKDHSCSSTKVFRVFDGGKE